MSEIQNLPKYLAREPTLTSTPDLSRRRKKDSDNMTPRKYEPLKYEPNDNFEETNYAHIEQDSLGWEGISFASKSRIDNVNQYAQTLQKLYKRKQTECKLKTAENYELRKYVEKLDSSIKLYQICSILLWFTLVIFIVIIFYILKVILESALPTNGSHYV